MKRTDFSPLRSRRWLGLGLALCAGVSGCNVIPAAQSDPTKFYVLSAPSAAGSSAATAATDAPAGKRVRIGLKTVDVAMYLKDPQIVVRSGSNEVELQDYARWAEPLQAGIGRLLREQLASASRVSRLEVQPFPLDQDLDYVVSVSVLHCEGATGGAEGKGARFEASIRVSTGGPTSEIVARKVYLAPAVGWDGKNFDALARHLSADVQGLGEAILQAIP